MSPCSTEATVECTQEINNCIEGRPVKEEFLFQVFSCAFVCSAPQAFDCVWKLNTGLVKNWLRHHPLFEEVYESMDNLVAAVFSRFWSAIRQKEDYSEKFQHLGAVRSYMKGIVHSVIMDQLREQSRRPDPLPTDPGDEMEDTGSMQPLPPSLTTPPVTDANLHFEQVWRRISALARNDDERLLLTCYFLLEMKPREIAAEHPDKWRDAGAVSVAVYRLMRRLEGDDELYDLLHT